MKRSHNIGTLSVTRNINKDKCMQLDLDEERDVWITPKGISQSPLHGPHAFTCDLLYMQVPQDTCPVRSAGLGLIVISLGTSSPI